MLVNLLEQYLCLFTRFPALLVARTHRRAHEKGCRFQVTDILQSRSFVHPSVLSISVLDIYCDLYHLPLHLPLRNGKGIAKMFGDGPFCRGIFWPQRSKKHHLWRRSMHFLNMRYNLRHEIPIFNIGWRCCNQERLQSGECMYVRQCAVLVCNTIISHSGISVVKAGLPLFVAISSSLQPSIAPRLYEVTVRQKYWFMRYHISAEVQFDQWAVKISRPSFMLCVETCESVKSNSVHPPVGESTSPYCNVGGACIQYNQLFSTAPLDAVIKTMQLMMKHCCFWRAVRRLLLRILVTFWNSIISKFPCAFLNECTVIGFFCWTSTVCLN